MIQGCENPQVTPLARRAPRVSYRMAEPAALLAEPGTLALFGFTGTTPASDDPRYLQVTLESFDAPAPLELWQVDAPVDSGNDGALRWSAGAGWLFVRSEERSVGKECVRQCRSRWSRDHTKKKQQTNQ